MSLEDREHGRQVQCRRWLTQHVNASASCGGREGIEVEKGRRNVCRKTCQRTNPMPTRPHANLPPTRPAAAILAPTCCSLHLLHPTGGRLRWRQPQRAGPGGPVQLLRMPYRSAPHEQRVRRQRRTATHWERVQQQWVQPDIVCQRHARRPRPLPCPTPADDGTFELVRGYLRCPGLSW